jgi:hypothetical protein
MAQYSYVTFLQMRQALAARLADPTNAFWSDSELKFYIWEALRTWNALTETWNTEFAFSTSSPKVWFDTSKMSGSPRLQTLTDDYLYKVMQYHLLEPATGAGTWTGTSQFSLADLQGALQRRRDEMIQVSGCNVTQLPPVPSTPNVRRTFFNDSTLEPRRTRFIPDSTYGSPITLLREDTMGFDSFAPDHLQTFGQTPTAWSVITGPPLAMDVDYAPPVAGQYDVLALYAGPTFNPPAATLLGVPDDWSWLAKWGALADLLSRDSEATDRERAAYCLSRYMAGLEIMKQSNWLLAATINGYAVDTPAVIAQDGFSPEWQNSQSAWSCLVTAGMDFCAPCPPAATSSIGVTLNLVGNAPCPILDGDFVQVSRDVYDVVLGYAQVLASFKMGGVEFKSTSTLEKDFFVLAQATNKRLANMGMFSDLIHAEGKREDRGQPR